MLTSRLDNGKQGIVQKEDEKSSFCLAMLRFCAIETYLCLDELPHSRQVASDACRVLVEYARVSVPDEQTRRLPHYHHRVPSYNSRAQPSTEVTHQNST